MRRTRDDDWALLPTDVFHDFISWREISRDEAVAAHDVDRVVVVFRLGSTESAAWFDRDHPFSVGVGPHALRDLRYFRYEKPRKRLDHAAKAGAAAAPTAPVTRTARKPAREPEKTWIAIELLDHKGQPVANEPYEIRLPDGTFRRGTLDARGSARIDGIDPGTCEVSFTRFDRADWGPN
jgi:hypothetical protein